MSSNFFFQTLHNPISFLFTDQLQCISIVMDLGIYYSSSLSFEHHINFTINRTLKVIDFIKRNTKYFKTHHCLMHCSLLWSDPFLNMVLLFSNLSLRKNFVYLPPPPHNYSLIYGLFYIQTLSSQCLKANQKLINSLLNESLNASDLLKRVLFRSPPIPLIIRFFSLFLVILTLRP